MYPLETNSDMRNLRWQYSVKNTQRQKLPAIVGRAVSRKMTEGQSGRWDRVVENRR